jgi:hypothetical protein
MHIREDSQARKISSGRDRTGDDEAPTRVRLGTGEDAPGVHPGGDGSEEASYRARQVVQIGHWIRPMTFEELDVHTVRKDVNCGRRMSRSDLPCQALRHRPHPDRSPDQRIAPAHEFLLRQPAAQHVRRIGVIEDYPVELDVAYNRFPSRARDDRECPLLRSPLREELRQPTRLEPLLSTSPDVDPERSQAQLLRYRQNGSPMSRDRGCRRCCDAECATIERRDPTDVVAAVRVRWFHVCGLESEPPAALDDGVLSRVGGVEGHWRKDEDVPFPSSLDHRAESSSGCRTVAPSWASPGIMDTSEARIEPTPGVRS